MKVRCFLLTTLFLIFAGSANAQQWSAPKLTTNVPFDFVVSGTTLPAGTYVVRTYDISGRTLMVQNRENPEFVAIVNNTNIMLSPGKTANSSGFVFALDNGQHVLHQIRIEGDNHICVCVSMFFSHLDRDLEMRIEVPHLVRVLQLRKPIGVVAT